MAYTEKSKNATLNYMKKHTKSICLRYRAKEYERNIAPYIQESGLPTSTFIKKAVEEKILRDFFSEDTPNE